MTKIDNKTTLQNLATQTGFTGTKILAFEK